MSEFAYFRFMSSNMLTVEEQQHKDEIISLTEQVLDAKGIECDSKISKISEEQLREILEGVRKLRKRRKIEEVYFLKVFLSNPLGPLITRVHKHVKNTIAARAIIAWLCSICSCVYANHAKVQCIVMLMTKNKSYP